MKTYFHGEVLIVKCKSIPSGATKLHTKEDIKIADSEVSGNDHMLQVKEGVEIYEQNGVFYLKNEVPVDVYCKIEARHDTITLEPSIWEIDKAQEYDYITMEKRNVAD